MLELKSNLQLFIVLLLNKVFINYNNRDLYTINAKSWRKKSNTIIIQKKARSQK